MAVTGAAATAPEEAPAGPSPHHLARWMAPVVVVFAALRILAVLGLAPGRFGDTSTYQQLSFVGHAERLWTVPLLYHLLRADAARIVAQLAIGIGCWWYAALTFADQLRDARLKVAGLLLVCAIALSIQVTNWDLTILSDSLAISLTVLLLSLWWRELRAPGRWTALALVTVTVLWTFTRESNVVMNDLLAIAAFVSVLWAPRRGRRLGIAVCVLAASLWGHAALRNDHYSTRININAIIIDRIEPVASYRTWWQHHGVPKLPRHYDEVERGSSHYRPHYVEWLDAHGEGTYVHFLLTHPRFTLGKPLPDLLPFSPGDLEAKDQSHWSVLGLNDHYGKVRTVLPSWVTLVVIDPGGAGLVLSLTAMAAVGVTLERRRRGYDRRWTVPLLVLALNVPHVLLVWHGSNAELGRHSLEISITTRLALWALTFLLADHWLAERRDTSAVVADRPVPPGDDEPDP
jgi:hypothetical protein